MFVKYKNIIVIYKMSNNYVRKILKHNDKYVIFYSSWCQYSVSALEKAKTSGKKYRFYDIDQVGGMQTVLNALRQDSEKINFNVNHSTRPIVFYNGKYVGGYSDM
jgi:glutaredoxin